MAVIDYLNNEPNENNEKIAELINQRNIIFEQMKEHLLNFGHRDIGGGVFQMIKNNILLSLSIPLIT